MQNTAGIHTVLSWAAAAVWNLHPLTTTPRLEKETFGMLGQKMPVEKTSTRISFKKKIIIKTS